MKGSSVRRFVPRPTYANVIATIALFVALGGAAVAAGLPKNSVGANQLKRGAVTAAKIRNKTITSGKLAAGSVAAGKLGANAVLPGNLGNGIISTAKIAAGAVVASSIKNGVITSNKLANGGVTSQKLADKAVTATKLGEGSVTAAKLADKSVTPEKLSFEVGGSVVTLKSGQTMRGVFEAGSLATAAGDIVTDSASYPMPLGVAPVVTKVVLPGEALTPACPGVNSSSAGPGAGPGALCLYLTSGNNLEVINPLTIENNTRFGFGLVVKAKEKEKVVAAVGQWAVTAP